MALEFMWWMWGIWWMGELWDWICAGDGTSFMCCLLFPVSFCACWWSLRVKVWLTKCGSFIFGCFSWCTETVDLHEGLQLGEIGVCGKKFACLGIRRVGGGVWVGIEAAMATGQLFSRTTQALFYNYKQSPVQRMLDFDFLCGMSLDLLMIWLFFTTSPSRSPIFVFMKCWSSGSPSK